jgi:hypothetical protein
MFKNRLFNILVIAALVVVTALTIQQALETTKVVSAATSVCTIPPVNRSSIRSAYVQEKGMWVSLSDSGPTGVDGGLLHLLSDYRTCSD